MGFTFYTPAGAQKTTAGLETPAGSIIDFAGNTPPDGWLLCDGAGISTATFSELFSVIGYDYGGSGGSFNVPDARGRVSVGLGANADVNALGDNDGIAESLRSPSHSHAIPHTHNMKNHIHTLSGHVHSMQGHTHSMQSHTHFTTITTSNNGSVHTHSGTTAASGSTNVAVGSGGQKAVNHTHAFTTSTANVQHNHTGGNSSGAPSTGSTGAASSTNTAGPNTANTSGPTDNVTDGTNTADSSALNAGGGGLGFITFNKIIKY